MRRLSIVAAIGLMLLATGCSGSRNFGGSGSSSTGTGTTGTGTTGTGTTGTGTTTPPATAAALTVATSATSIPSDGSASATITALALNTANNLIANVPVTFSSDSGGIAVTQATTGANGAATAVLSTAGDTTPRTITVTAKASGLTATVKVQVLSTASATTTTVASLTMTSTAASILSDGSTMATISALARDGANNVLAGVPVTFTSTSGAIQVTQATTNAAGMALATLSTGGDSSLRTITVNGSTAALSSSVQVKVVAPSTPTAPTYSMGNGTGTAFEPNVIAVAVQGNLPAGGETGVQVSIVDQTGTLYTAAPVVVTFNSPCLASGHSQILPSGSTTPVTTITTSTGSIDATYVAAGCSGTDKILASATVGGQSVSASATITVTAASVGSIQFLSATPTTIGLKGTGLDETSTVVFKVTDSSGGAQVGVKVAFSLDTSVGGMSLSPTTAMSASDGTVQTVVSAGTVHTPVRVTASIASPALSTQSSQLTVTTGLPASGGFDVAVGAAKYAGASNNLACPNVEAWNIDGVTVPITAFLADRYNNPVPDGTAVAFYTNGGHVDGSCVTGPPSGVSGEGTCTVTWTSANPRPKTSDDPSQPNNNVLVNGRAQVLATAVGEESFTDTNASGFYQAGDPFSNLGEPFLSTDESGVYAQGNYFLDYFEKGVYQGPSGKFIGITCTGTTPSSTCSTSTLAIGASHLVIMSTSDADIQLTSFAPQGGHGFTGNSGTVHAPQLTMPVSIAAVAPTGTPPTGGVAAVTYSGTIMVELQDYNCKVTAASSPYCAAGTGNPLPAGTSVTAVLNNTSIGTLSVTPVIIGCATDIGGVFFQFAFTSSTTGGSGTITVTATTPNGTINSFPIGVTVD
jgi:Bacterial Ig-like domain (group 1)